MQLVENLKDRGPANYHHHYHNAIVGEDSVGRYNAKWLDVNDYKNRVNDLGGVQVGDFRRG